MQHEIRQLTHPELRQFGLITGGIFISLFCLLLPWLWRVNLPIWPWVIGGIFILPALAYPSALSPLYHIWMRIGLVIGWFMSRIILSLVFYLIVLPIGLIMRLRGYDPMQRHYDPNATTYRNICSPMPIQRMEKPF